MKRFIHNFTKSSDHDFEGVTMSTCRSLEIEDAIKYGVNRAFILKHLEFWVLHSIQFNINYQDNRYWAFRTRKKIREDLPFMEEQMIKRSLLSLIELKVINVFSFSKGEVNYYCFADIEREKLIFERYGVVTSRSMLINNAINIEQSRNAYHKNIISREIKSTIAEATPDQNVPGSDQIEPRGRLILNRGVGSKLTGGSVQIEPHIEDIHKEEIKEDIKEKNTLLSSNDDDTEQTKISSFEVETKASKRAHEVMKLWNEESDLHRNIIPRILKLTDKRVKAIQNASKTHLKDLREWGEFIAMIYSAPFLIGANKNGWKADFDWAIKSDNIVKILEGKYAASKAAGMQTQAHNAQLRNDNPYQSRS